MKARPLTKKATEKPDDATQSAAFIEKAREIEADGDASPGDVLMGRLAKMKPEPRPKPRDSTSRSSDAGAAHSNATKTRR